MKQIEVGDWVTFKPSSTLPKASKIPADATGKVARKHLEPQTGKAWVDIDFGLQGFVFGVDVEEFSLTSAG